MKSKRPPAFRFSLTALLTAVTVLSLMFPLVGVSETLFLLIAVACDIAFFYSAELWGPWGAACWVAAVLLSATIASQCAVIWPH